MKSTFIPKYRTIKYVLNQSSWYYEKQPDKIAFNRLPFELKVEETQLDNIKKSGANEIIRGRTVNGRYAFFSGIIPVERVNWFFGNDYKYFNGKKVLSLLIFEFSSDNRELYIYYFDGFYIDSRPHRIAFVNEFLDTVKR